MTLSLDEHDLIERLAQRVNICPVTESSGAASSAAEITAAADLVTVWHAGTWVALTASCRSLPGSRVES